MGQCFGSRGCCRSNRSRIEPAADSIVTSPHKKAPAQAWTRSESDFDDIGTTITHKKAYDQAWTSKKAQACIPIRFWDKRQVSDWRQE